MSLELTLGPKTPSRYPEAPRLLGAPRQGSFCGVGRAHKDHAEDYTTEMGHTWNLDGVIGIQGLGECTKGPQRRFRVGLRVGMPLSVDKRSKRQ